MLGVALGAACGAVEFLLLKRLVDGVTGGELSYRLLVLIPLKLLALAAFFVPCALIAPDELYLCGIAAVAVLLVCAVTLFVVRTQKRKPQIGSDGK